MNLFGKPNTVNNSNVSPSEGTLPPQPSESENRSIITTVDRLALLASPDVEMQAHTSARITALIEAQKVSEEQLEEFAFVASGTGKVNEAGALIVNKDAPLFTSINTIIGLLEDDVPPHMVMLTIQLKRLFDSTTIELPDLIDEDRLQRMSEQEFAKYLVRSLNLSLDTLEDFCSEFNFDLEQMVGSEKDTVAISSATDELEALAEGIMFVMQHGPGLTIDQRLESFIRLSKSRPELRGDFERIRELF